MRLHRALLPALVVAGLLIWRFDFVVDDAFISFRYARNLAEGHGLRFDADSLVPVEGYSNLLWVLVLALVHLAGIDPRLGARAVSVLCALGLVLLFGSFVRRRLDPGGPALAVSALFLATLPPIAVWSTGGLETMAFAFFVFLGFERLHAAEPRGLAAGAALLVAALLRADGFVAAGLVLGATWLGERARPTDPATPPRSPRGALRAAATVLVLGVAAHFLWRHAYHGAWVPNTAGAKVGGFLTRVPRGLRYVAGLALALPSLLLALLGFLPPAARRARDERARAALRQAAWVLLGLVAWAAFVGGDWMPFGRYLVPAMPFAALGFAAWIAPRSADGGADGAGASRWARPLALGAPCLALSLLPAFGVHAIPASIRGRVAFRTPPEALRSELFYWRRDRRFARDWSLAGRALATVAEPGDSIVFGLVGALAYYSRVKVYDCFGLVSREVIEADVPVRAINMPGHDRWVPLEFFFAEHPTWMTVWISAADAPEETMVSWSPEDAEHDAPSERTWPALPYADRVVLERHPLAVEDGFPPGTELRALRFVDWGDVAAPLAPFVAAVRDLDLERPAESEAELARRLDPDGPAAARLAAELVAFVQAQDLTEVGAMRVGRLLAADARTHGYTVDVALLDATGLPHRHPRGEVDFVLALEGAATLDGRGPGWVVLPPGSSHLHGTDQGRLLVLSFLPGGELEPE